MSDPAVSLSPHNGMTSPGPARKRKRKSRKGLEKRFTCEIDACGKVYSRAEHLQRHQLNHSSPQTFRCQFPDCSRTFVRPDLLKRHLDRHVAKGTHVDDTNAATARSPSPQTPEAAMHHQGYTHPAHALPINDPYRMSAGTTSQFGNIAVDSHMAATSTIPGRVEEVPLQNPPNHNPHQVDMGYSLATTKYTQAPRRQSTSHETSPAMNHMAIYDHMSMGDAGPVFGADAGLHKSPTGGMPEDFMAYLFDSTSNTSGGGNTVLPATAINYGDLNQNQYPNSNSYLATQSGPIQQIGPQQIMSVYNLLEPNMPEASMSDARSQELFDYIKDRFHGDESQDSRQTRDSIISGDRSRSDHMLSKRMMQAYIGSFWKHFSAQMPIVRESRLIDCPTLISCI